MYADHPEHPDFVTPGPRGERILRRVKQVVLLLASLVVLLSASLVLTALIDDIRIARHPASSIAEVTRIDGPRTVVRFRDHTGQIREPWTGLKFPTGLDVGDRVRVEYQATDPENVKVEGRRWTLAILPALSTMLGGLAIVAILWGGVVSVERRLWPTPTDRRLTADSS